MTRFGKRLIKGLEGAVVLARRDRGNTLAAVHETALGLAEAGVISKRTMAAFDELCSTQVAKLSAARIRLREKASQAAFARYLNVTTGLISQWERGEKHPRGAALMLLTPVANGDCGRLRDGGNW